jgi:hypothetical protein
MSGACTDSEMDGLHIAGNAFHPEWNYTITPTACGFP